MAFGAGDRYYSRIIRIPMGEWLTRNICMSGRAERVLKWDNQLCLDGLGDRWRRRCRAAACRQYDGPHDCQSEKNESSLQRH
jgi:hypothetical protein